MEQLKQLIARLSVKQRASIIVAVVLALAGLYGLTQWRHERDFQTLYSDLAPEDAGAIMARLKESGVEYRVGDNGALLVPSARVAELRLQLAASGLPKSGRIGYELFDRTNLGTTEFAEQINYRRALEGELERSILSLAEVDQARVHITFPKDSVFLESRQPAKASITLKLRQTGHLNPNNVIAIAHLISSAVEGLTPENVSIIDGKGTLLSKVPTQAQDGEVNATMIEYRQKLERDLLSKVNSTLEPLLGPDHFRAGVFVDCDYTSGETSEESFDPNRSVMTNAQRSEENSTGSTTGGVPGTSSNLPRPLPRSTSGSSGVMRRTENIAYQSSRSVRRMKVPQGVIKRLSVSVLVDHRVRWQGTGTKAKRLVEPPPEESLKAIRELVAGATGFSADRGDQLVVQALAFDATLQPQPSAPDTPAPAAGLTPLQRNGLLAGGVVLLLLIVGALFLLSRRGKKKRAQAAARVLDNLPAGQMAPTLASGMDAALPDSPEQARLAGETQAMAANPSVDWDVEHERQLTQAVQTLKISVKTTRRSEALVRHFQEEAQKHPTVIAQLIRTWLEEGTR